mmetsp:Transcript_27935/g.83525  ORF Transcript_27935/g.83525 Transcript_27935/m.83525 type:complete len:270 (+) Transcript_27935:688-1497(+)
MHCFSCMASNTACTATMASSSTGRLEVRPSRNSCAQCSSPDRSQLPPARCIASRRRVRTTSWTLATRAASASRARASRSRRLRSAPGSRTSRSASSTSGWFLRATMRWFSSFRSFRFFCPGSCAARSSNSANCLRTSATTRRASSNSLSAISGDAPMLSASSPCPSSSPTGNADSSSACLFALLGRRDSSASPESTSSGGGRERGSLAALCSPPEGRNLAGTKDSSVGAAGPCAAPQGSKPGPAPPVALSLHCETWSATRGKWHRGQWS